MYNGYTYNAIGAHTEDASVSTATPLAPPTGANILIIQPITQNIRYTLDGTTPTASVGFRILANTVTFISVGSGMTVNVIEETASASIQYQWAIMVPVAGSRPART